MNRYEAVFKCGFCHKEIDLTDETIRLIMEGKQEIHSLCDCGHVSYCSSIRAKFLVDTKGWIGVYGRSK